MIFFAFNNSIISYIFGSAKITTLSNLKFKQDLSTNLVYLAAVIEQNRSIQQVKSTQTCKLLNGCDFT